MEKHLRVLSVLRVGFLVKLGPLHLRCVGEHLDQVIMQAVVELALEGPLELRVIEVARVQLEIIGVHRYRRVLELDDHGHALPILARVKLQQRVLVAEQLPQHAVEARVGGKCRHFQLTGQAISDQQLASKLQTKRSVQVQALGPTLHDQANR